VNPENLKVFQRAKKTPWSLKETPCVGKIMHFYNTLRAVFSVLLLKLQSISRRCLLAICKVNAFRPLYHWKISGFCYAKNQHFRPKM